MSLKTPLLFFLKAHGLIKSRYQLDFLCTIFIQQHDKYISLAACEDYRIHKVKARFIISISTERSPFYSFNRSYYYDANYYTGQYEAHRSSILLKFQADGSLLFHYINRGYITTDNIYKVEHEDLYKLFSFSYDSRYKVKFRQITVWHCSKYETYVVTACCEALILNLSNHEFTTLNAKGINIYGNITYFYRKILQISYNWQNIYLSVLKTDQHKLIDLSLSGFDNYALKLQDYLKVKYGDGFFTKRLRYIPLSQIKKLITIAHQNRSYYHKIYQSLINYCKHIKYDKAHFTLYKMMVYHHTAHFAKELTKPQALYIEYYYQLPSAKFIPNSKSFKNFIKRASTYTDKQFYYENFMPYNKHAARMLPYNRVGLKPVDVYSFEPLCYEEQIREEVANMDLHIYNIDSISRNKNFLVYHVKVNNDVNHKGYVLVLENYRNDLAINTLRGYENKAPSTQLQQLIYLQIRKSGKTKRLSCIIDTKFKLENWQIRQK